MLPLNCSCIAGQKLTCGCDLSRVVATPSSFLCSAVSDNLGELRCRELIETLDGAYVWRRKLIILALFGGLGRVFEELRCNLQSLMSAIGRDAFTQNNMKNQPALVHNNHGGSRRIARCSGQTASGPPPCASGRTHRLLRWPSRPCNASHRVLHVSKTSMLAQEHMLPVIRRKPIHSTHLVQAPALPPMHILPADKALVTSKYLPAQTMPQHRWERIPATAPGTMSPRKRGPWIAREQFAFL